jgi:hypothetical protein
MPFWILAYAILDFGFWILDFGFWMIKASLYMESDNLTYASYLVLIP